MSLSEREQYASVEGNLQRIVKGYRQLEMLPYSTGLVDKRIARWRYFAGVWKQTKEAEQRLLQFFDGKVLPALDVFNDNRYEQHWWPWRIAASEVTRGVE